MIGQRQATPTMSASQAANRWELMALQDFVAEELYQFYERSGRYEFAGCMERVEADKRAFMEVARVTGRGGVV